MIRIYLLHETSFVPLCTYSSPSKVQLCICIVYISRYVLFIPVYCNSEVVQNYSIKLQEKRGLKTEEMQVLQEKVIRPFATVSKKTPKLNRQKIPLSTASADLQKSLCDQKSSLFYQAFRHNLVKDITCLLRSDLGKQHT